MTFTKKQASDMVTQLAQINLNRADNVYAMAQLTHAFKSGRLYTLLGYKSLSEFVYEDERVVLSLHQINMHADFYAESRRLKYSKPECIKMLQAAGVSRLSRAMKQLDNKIAVGKLVDMSMTDHRYQIAFAVEPEEMELVEAVLSHYGLEVDEYGRRHGSSEAFADAMAELKRLKNIRKAA